MKFSILNSQFSIQRGQSLYEIVLALGLISVVVVAVVSLVAGTLRNIYFSKNKTQATRFSQEAIEWIRGQRDESWQTFATQILTPKWCLITLSWSGASHAGSCREADFISASIFKREVDFTQIDANTIEAKVKTFWTDSQGFHEVLTTTYFTNWRPFTTIPLGQSGLVDAGSSTPTPTASPTPAPRQLIETRPFDSGFREGNVGCCGWSDGCDTHNEDEGCSVTSGYTFSSPSGVLSFEADLLGTLGIRHGAADAHTDLQRLCVDASCWDRGQYICKANGPCCDWHFEETWNRGRVGPFSTAAGRSHAVSYLVQGYCSDWGESFRSKVAGNIYFYSNSANPD